MGKKLYPTDTLAEAQDILLAWNMIDPSLTFGPLNPQGLEKDMQSVHELEEKIDRLQKELMEVRYQRDRLCIGIWSTVKRTRAGIKAIYGDDSSEYKLAGGTRLSDRKTPRQKVLTEQKEETLTPAEQGA